MKPIYLLSFLMLTILLTGCKEKYKSINPDRFNKSLAVNTNIKTAQDLVTAYDTTLLKEVVPQHRLSVSSKKIENNDIEITAIINVNDDDELAAEKFIFTAHQAGVHWTVSAIRYNWKNQDGYGHTDWGI